MSEESGMGIIEINDSLVSVFTREQRIATFVYHMLTAGLEGAVKDGATEEELSGLNEAIQWLSEKMKG